MATSTTFGPGMISIDGARRPRVRDQSPPICISFKGANTSSDHLTSPHRAKAQGLAALVAAASLSTLIVSTSPSASADPQSATALVGVGSDTTQDVMNALSGFNNGRNYTPIQSSAATGFRQIASFDAIVGGTPGTCITPKAPGATFDRPNGSTNGRRALSRAIDGTPWSVPGSPCPPPKVISGLVDFARSSAGPSGTGSDLTYLGFGRDALSFAYVGNGVTPVTSLTSAQLNSLFTSGPQTINGVQIVPCSIQTGSGTFQSFNTAVGAPPAQMAAATATCGATIQENDANGLQARSATFPGRQLVIGFSAANFIAQRNGVSPSQLNNAASVDLGSIDALGKPYSGTGSSLTPNPAFYNNTTYGRTVYNVVDSARVGGPPSANADLKTLFVGPGSAICSPAAQATVNAFGFASLAPGTCGALGVTGPLITSAPTP